MGICGSAFIVWWNLHVTGFKTFESIFIGLDATYQPALHQAKLNFEPANVKRIQNISFFDNYVTSNFPAIEPDWPMRY
jgi:hypothetical protein